MWTEQPDLTDEQRKHKAVIATVDETDTVLRVGIGCNTEWQSHSGGTGCKKSRRLDALRVYKSGALYLKKPDGKVIPDVQAALEKSQQELKEVKETLAAVLDRLKALE